MSCVYELPLLAGSSIHYFLIMPCESTDEDSRAASESGRDNRISVFEPRGVLAVRLAVIHV